MASHGHRTPHEDVGASSPGPSEAPPEETPESAGTARVPPSTLAEVWRNRGPRHRGLVMAALIVTLGVAWIALRPGSPPAPADGATTPGTAADACRPVLDAVVDPEPGSNPLLDSGIGDDRVPLSLIEAGVRTYQCVADETGSTLLAIHVDIGGGSSRGSLFLLSPAAPADLAGAWLEGTGSPWAGAPSVGTEVWRFFGSSDDPLYGDLEASMSEGAAPPVGSLFDALVARDPTQVHPQG